MTASHPTILATSGGLAPSQRHQFEFGPLIKHAVELAEPAGTPRLCWIGTALGDQRTMAAGVDEAGRTAGYRVSHLHLFPMPNVADIAEHLLAQDVIWVGGGSVAGLLAMWRLHGLHEILPRVWQAGVVLGGVSAGSLCWHIGGTTDSFGPQLQPVTNGLGLLPYSNCPHYDSEEQRRPLFQRLVGQGSLPEGYASDDGVGLVFRETTFAEAVTEERGKAAFRVRPVGDGEASEERIEPTALPGAR